MISAGRRALNRMRIQYASDLHLEFRGGPFPALLKPVAPVLVLAGDIGRPDKPEYRNFLQYCSRNWEHTVIVAGNHEFYNDKASGMWSHFPPHTVMHRRGMCGAAAAEFSNVHFLQQGRKVIDGVAFLGATLWTDLSNSKDALVAETRMNDFHVITETGDVPITAADVNRWHWADRSWLLGEIAACAEEARPAVVVTHHLPSFQLIASRFAGAGRINAAFASNAEDLIRPPVAAWIAGHTHVGVHARINGVQVCVNPMGYPGEEDRGATGYCRELFLEISTELAGGSADFRDPMLVAASGSLDDEATAPSSPAPQRREARAQSSDSVEML
jgi:Calcineurin-like phosphoesterase